MKLRALLDPRQWLAPDVRAGIFAHPEIKLKTGTVIQSRSQAPVSRDVLATIQAALPAPRFVRAGTEAPPDGLVRRLSPYVLERWETVLETCPSSSLEEIAAFASRGPRVLGYRVTQEVQSKTCDCRNQHGVNMQGVHVACGRAVAQAPEVQEVLLSIGMQTKDDETYNGFYPTLPGSDVAHANYGAKGMAEHQEGKALRGDDGSLVRGGREIRGGRREWKAATKNMVLWDAGTRKHMARLNAEKQAKKKAEDRAFIEREVRKASPRLGEL